MSSIRSGALPVRHQPPSDELDVFAAEPGVLTRLVAVRELRHTQAQGPGASHPIVLEVQVQPSQRFAGFLRGEQAADFAESQCVPAGIQHTIDQLAVSTVVQLVDERFLQRRLVHLQQIVSGAGELFCLRPGRQQATTFCAVFLIPVCFFF
jgi:hypothetical protein